MDPRTGAPEGIGKGWDYAPGASAVSEILQIVADKVVALPPELAQAFLGDLLERFADSELANALREMLTRVS
ncbi:MAG: hypothetical protein ACU0A5_05870 [Salipiger marinus]|uniref:hypothetical protein n=1 Tax=Salipiger marinus TaxID=555512 RepID=UPI004057F59D